MSVNVLKRVLFILLFLAVALALVYFAFKGTIPDLIPLLKSGNVDEIQAFLRSSGTWRGIVAISLLQMLQVFSLVISGLPIQVAAGVVYGTFFALLICLCSSTFALTLSLYLLRRLGRRMAKWFPVEEKQLRIIDKLTQAGTPPRFAVFLAGMIPVLPNGLIPLLASKLDIRATQFAFWVCIGSLPNMLLCCAIGNRLIHGDWLASILYVTVMMGLVIGLWKWQNQVIALFRKLTRPKAGKGGGEKQ